MSEEREILRQSAAFIAEALGDGWRVDTVSDYGWQTAIFGPADEVLHLSKADRTIHFSRLAISGGYNHLADKYDQYPRNLDHVKITVSRDRGPEAIAREISRRLLPKYREEIERVKASVASDRAATSAREAAEGCIAEITGSSAGYLNLSEGYGSVKVNYGGETATVELRGISVGLAIEVLKLATGQ